MADEQSDLFKLLQGLKPIDAEARNALTDFQREMTERAVPEIIKEDEKRRMLAADSRRRRLERPKTDPPASS